MFHIRVELFCVLLVEPGGFSGSFIGRQNSESRINANLFSIATFFQNDC